MLFHSKASYFFIPHVCYWLFLSCFAGIPWSQAPWWGSAAGQRPDQWRHAFGPFLQKWPQGCGGIPSRALQCRCRTSRYTFEICPFVVDHKDNIIMWWQLSSCFWLFGKANYYCKLDRSFFVCNSGLSQAGQGAILRSISAWRQQSNGWFLLCRMTYITALKDCIVL